MNKITGHTLRNYTLLVDGNGGENQLVITSSAGQNGKTIFSVIAVSVDLGMRVLAYRTYIQTREVPAFVKQQLIAWVSHGVPPTWKEFAAEMSNIAVITKYYDHAQ